MNRSLSGLMILLSLFAFSAPGVCADETLDPSLLGKTFYVVKTASAIPTNGDQAKSKDPKCSLTPGGQMKVLGESADHTKIAFQYTARSSSSSGGCEQGTLGFIEKSSFYEQLSLLSEFKRQCHEGYKLDYRNANEVSDPVKNLNDQMKALAQQQGIDASSVVDLSKPRKHFVPDDCETLVPEETKARNGTPAQAVTLRTEKGIMMLGTYQDTGKVPALAIPAN